MPTWCRHPSSCIWSCPDYSLVLSNAAAPFLCTLSAFKLKLKSLIIRTLCSTISHPLQTLLKSKWLICRGLSRNVMKCAAGAADFDLNMWNKWDVAPGDLCSTCECEAWLKWSVFPFFSFFFFHATGFASWTVVDFYVFKSWSLDGTETAEYLQIGSGRERPPLVLSSWYHGLHQKGNKKKAGGQIAVWTEQGEEMGFRFAQMIFPDTDSSDISLREDSAVLAAVVCQCGACRGYSTLGFHIKTSFSRFLDLYLIFLLISW